MTSRPEFMEALIRRLQDVTALTDAQAEAIIAEVFDACERDVDAFIQDRHSQLQRQGYRGDEIYEQIRCELEQWRFTSPALSLRQIRRRIYG